MSLEKNKQPITYKDSGVDTEKGQEFVKNIKTMVHSTHDKKVIGGLGGFAAAYDASFLKNYENPILLSGTDGVGTKVEIARLLNKHDTVGIDLVAMCVNDLLVLGGKPLFFQDYISCGKLNLEKMQSIVSGIVEGCHQSGASLVGGETAEHPGIMEEDEYDLAGFVVGVVEKSKMIDGRDIQPGDVLIGLESSGPHSNGFSLIRKLLLEDGKLPLSKNRLEILRDLAMKPTTIYVPYILKLLESLVIKGMVHVTGGGFYENIPRVLQAGQGVELNSKGFPRLEFFERLENEFTLEKETLYSTFNMGIGFILVVSSADADIAMEKCSSLGIRSYNIGTVVAEPGVLIH
jgi:phosphoribosylformylglycinamidine cyclo-ligase